jgi:hypothetical protein
MDDRFYRRDVEAQRRIDLWRIYAARITMSSVVCRLSSREEVVRGCPDAGPCQVAKGREVGREQEEGE